jgi:hypothetical protein
MQVACISHPHAQDTYTNSKQVHAMDMQLCGTVKYGKHIIQLSIISTDNRRNISWQSFVSCEQVSRPTLSAFALGPITPMTFDGSDQKPTALALSESWVGSRGRLAPHYDRALLRGILGLGTRPSDCLLSMKVTLPSMVHHFCAFCTDTTHTTVTKCCSYCC